MDLRLQNSLYALRARVTHTHTRTHARTHARTHTHIRRLHLEAPHQTRANEPMDRFLIRQRNTVLFDVGSEGTFDIGCQNNVQYESPTKYGALDVDSGCV